MTGTLVACFSATVTTLNIAQIIAKSADADLYQIIPEQPYTKADLDWMDRSSRSSVEMKDSKFRPQIKDQNLSLENYDVIYLGFPIWWYVAPTIINTFLESHDFSGKKIILFATSGGSGFGNTVRQLQSSAPNAVIKEGRVFNHVTKQEIIQWVKNTCKEGE